MLGRQFARIGRRLEANLRTYAPLFIHHHLDSLAYVRPGPEGSLPLSLSRSLSVSLGLARTFFLSPLPV